MVESSSHPQQRSLSSRAGRRRNARRPYMSLQLTAVFASLVMLQIVSNTDQATTEAALPRPVVRVLRVDVPPVVRTHEAKPEAGKPAAPLLFGCTYALEGGENDDENGETTTVTTTTMAAAATSSTARAAVAGSDPIRGERSAPDLASDASEIYQRDRGVVVKWYFRRNPTPAGVDPLTSYIDDSVQVYQWIAGSGTDSSVGLGPLSGHTVDVTAQMPRAANKSVLHHVFRVDRPTAELTGEYRCQVEDWVTERRSAWQPMVVYTPERVFKISVNDNDDDDENDMTNTEDSGEEGNSTTQEPSSSTTIRGGAQQPSAASKDLPTEINITCYAAGVHPEPTMSIWVNGLMQDNVTAVVTIDDGDDDETNDDDGVTSTTSAPTTARPKIRGRYRANDVVYRNYAVRAAKVVQLKDVDDRRKGKYMQPKYHNLVDVECQLRVPGDGAGDGYWKADRPPSHYYTSHQRNTYNVRRPGDPADAAVSSASKTDDVDKDEVDKPSMQESTNGAGSTLTLPFVLFQSAFAAAAAALIAGRLQ